MDSPPTVETVCAAIATLYHNPDRTEKDKASNWLQILQKSVYAWKVRSFGSYYPAVLVNR